MALTLRCLHIWTQQKSRKSSVKEELTVTAEALSRASFCARVIAALQLPFNYECFQ